MFGKSPQPSTVSFTGIGLMLGWVRLARALIRVKAPGLRLFKLHLLICMFKSFRPYKFILFFFLVEKKENSPLPPPPSFPNLYFEKKW
jgi:hypothetical protein